MGFTQKQLEAIDHNDGAAVISAAAGSGKTTVLVERVTRLIADKTNGINADELVVSTFTNEAADKLRVKITEALDKKLAELGDGDDGYLRMQRLRLADAHISTISSFCLDLLRLNSADAGLQPGFTVIDQSEGELMYGRALKATLEDYCENGDPAERDMLYNWFLGETDDRLAEAVTQLYKFSRDLPDRDGFFNDQLAFFDDPENMSPETKARLEAYVKKHVLPDLEAVRDLLPRLRELAKDTGAAKVPDRWQELVNAAAAVTDLDSCVKECAAVSACSVPMMRGKKDETLPEDLKAVGAEMREHWNGAVGYMKLVANRDSDMKTCKPVFEALVKLMKSVERTFSAMKRDRGVVDFADIELMTIDLLRAKDGGQSDFAKELSESIKIIIVDEFQDSNEIQYEIFRLLSRNKTNLYFVGDIKQSIYRFRGADPSVFLRLTKDPDFTVIDLNANFRSCDEVINSVNDIFTGTMTEELGDVDYNEKCALVRANTLYRTDKDLNRTEFIIFGGGKKADNRRSEAEYIAWRIKTMIAEEFPVTKPDGEKRGCDYGDFAVIMGHYKSNIDIYKDAFERAGVPFEANESEDYTAYTEVKLAMSLLKVIDDPYSSSDLAAVLMNEPFMFSAQEMADIKTAGGTKHRYLWTGLNEFAKTSPHAAVTVREINRFREFAAENSAERLIRMICDESMLVPAVQASKDGEKRCFNLHKLIHYAETFACGECAGLGDFIGYMEDLSARKVKLPQAKGSGAAGAVRFMTIHGSKGLEFPICFVSNLFSQSRPVSDEIVCDPVCGIGMKISDYASMTVSDTAAYRMTVEEIKRQNDSENMRLLYVAATRAMEKLIFTAPEANTKPGQHYGWVLHSGAVNEDDPGNATIKVERVTNGAYGQDEELAADECGEAYIPDYTEYKYGSFAEAPAKVTATQIGVKSVDEFSASSSSMDRFLRMPTFADTDDREAKKLQGKKRGDAYHKVMERLDFSMSAADIPAMLDELFREGTLSEAERCTVSEDDIAVFLAGDIARRAAASSRVEREFPLFGDYDPEPGEWGIEDWSGEEKPIMQGVADMFFVEDGEIVLVDYKTNTGPTAEKLAEEYRGQLRLYAAALTEATGLRVKQKLLYSFERGMIEIV